MTDQLKLYESKAMDIQRPLSDAVQRILAVSQPSKIILFGSQARGVYERSHIQLLK